MTWIPSSIGSKDEVPTTFRNDKKKHYHAVANKLDLIDRFVSDNKFTEKFNHDVSTPDDNEEEDDAPSVYDYIEELDLINQMLRPDGSGGATGIYDPINNVLDDGDYVIEDMKNHNNNNFIDGDYVIEEMKNPNNNFIDGDYVIEEMKNPDNNFIDGDYVIEEMKNPNNNFIDGDNVIEEMKNPNNNFIDGDNVIEEMKNPNNNFIEGDNVIPEMRPSTTTTTTTTTATTTTRPSRPSGPPVYLPTYKPGAQAKTE